MESSEVIRRVDEKLATIHGFRVQSYGMSLSSGFKRALRRLTEKGFDDSNCVVVKTKNGSRSGITHAGGRYVDVGNLYRSEVIRQMRELEMEPPPFPFIVAPGEYTLYHEWGHHVDHTWSRGDGDVGFSFRWFSHFYKLEVRSLRIAHAGRRLTVDYNDVAQPIESDTDAASAVMPWRHMAAELFANLFEDWMRGDKKVSWDVCEPSSLNSPTAQAGHDSVTTTLLPGITAESVREKTYTLFAAGLRTVPNLPAVRSGLFGPFTDRTVGQLREVLAGARAGRW